MFFVGLCTPLPVLSQGLLDAIDLYSVQYLTPIDDDRQIDTLNVDLYTHLSTTEALNLDMYWGGVITYAEGHIIQLEGSLEQGNLREVRHDNSAFGIGPGVLLRFGLWQGERVSLSVQGSGHFVIYNKRFPAGGDYYNFMWRGGPTLAFTMSDRRRLGIGYQWTHVSNGQGEAARNPSYEAGGISVVFSMEL